MTDEMTPMERHALAYLTHTAKAFESDNSVGWMEPDGTVRATERWCHCHYFIENEHALPAVYELLKPHWDEFEEPRLEGHRSSGRQWHEYVEVPMTVEGELANEVRRLAYQHGWGRIGTYGRDKFELECSAEHERSLRRHARKFAQLLGRELTVLVVDTHELSDETTHTPKP